MVNIMMTVKGNVLTETGAVKAGARKALAGYVNEHRDIFAGAVRNENGTYSVAVKDGEGHTVYVNFEVTVSTMCAGDRAKRKSRAKATQVADGYEVE